MNSKISALKYLRIVGKKNLTVLADKITHIIIKMYLAPEMDHRNRSLLLQHLSYLLYKRCPRTDSMQ